MYSLKSHIAKTRAKGEPWTEHCLIDIMTEVCPHSQDLACNEWTLAKLEQMAKDQREFRDEHEDDFLTFTKEWSKLSTLEQVRDLVALELNREGSTS